MTKTYHILPEEESRIREALSVGPDRIHNVLPTCASVNAWRLFYLIRDAYALGKEDERRESLAGIPAPEYPTP